MKLHPATYAILHFTPWARLRSHRDRFYPLFFIALAVLAVDVGCLLRLESLYREDARSRSTPPVSVEAPVARFSHEPGAVVTGEKSGHPTLQF